MLLSHRSYSKSHISWHVESCLMRTEYSKMINRLNLQTLIRCMKSRHSVIALCSCSCCWFLESITTFSFLSSTFGSTAGILAISFPDFFNNTAAPAPSIANETATLELVPKLKLCPLPFCAPPDDKYLHCLLFESDTKSTVPNLPFLEPSSKILRPTPEAMMNIPWGECNPVNQLLFVYLSDNGEKRMLWINIEF